VLDVSGISKGIDYASEALIDVEGWRAMAEQTRLANCERWGKASFAWSHFAYHIIREVRLEY
jgi:hypothetical protein